MADEQPQTLMPQDGSVLKAKLAGVFIVLLALVMGYFFIVQPVQEARRTGHMEYYVKGVVMPPLFLYAGVAVLCFDMRNGQVRVVDATGKRKYTRKGWFFLVGAVVVMCGSLALWVAYLHSMGFESGLWT